MYSAVLYEVLCLMSNVEDCPVLEGEEGGTAGVEELVEALEVGDVPRHQLQVLLLLSGVKNIAPGMAKRKVKI